MSIARLLLSFVDQHFCLKVLVCLCTKSCNLGTCHLKQSSDKKQNKIYTFVSIWGRRASRLFYYIHYVSPGMSPMTPIC